MKIKDYEKFFKKQLLSQSDFLIKMIIIFKRLLLNSFINLQRFVSINRISIED